jgi:hypothetical protein
MDFRFELIPAHLGRAGSRLDRWRACLRHMTEIIGDFFQRPAGYTDPMREIMPKVVNGEIPDQIPFAFGRTCFERAEPMMNSSFGEPGTAL